MSITKEYSTADIIKILEEYVSFAKKTYRKIECFHVFSAHKDRLSKHFGRCYGPGVIVRTGINRDDYLDYIEKKSPVELIEFNGIPIKYLDEWRTGDVPVLAKLASTT